MSVHITRAEKTALPAGECVAPSVTKLGIPDKFHLCTISNNLQKLAEAIILAIPDGDARGLPYSADQSTS
jgi:hypothetical protein